MEERSFGYILAYCVRCLIKEERTELLWKISLLKTQLYFWNYCNWLIPIIISLRQIVFKIVLCNLILCTWVFFIIKLIFHKISYPLCSDSQLVNMWHSWKRLAYLYISNGHISSIKASFPNIMSFSILYKKSNTELFINWSLANM